MSKEAIHHASLRCRCAAEAWPLRRGRRDGLPWALLPGLLLALSGCGRDGTSFLQPHGAVAAAQRHWLIDITLWMMIVVLPVFILVPAFAWRYRRRNRKAAYRPDWEFWWPLEVAIWGIPVVIVAVLATLIAGPQTRLDPYAAIQPGQAPLRVQVIGLNWKWLFLYPDQRVATVGVLALPVGRPISFQLTSDATMQSFFIPALGSQIYAMAGMVTQLNLIADRPGAMIGENTQFNGTGFASERFTVSAMAPQDFDAWCSAQRRSGRILDADSYRTLSRDGTADKARSDFGVQPGAALSFSIGPPGLFRSVVAKYQPSMTAAMSPPSP